MEFEEIRELVAGFQPAKLVLAALDLGVFDALSTGAKDAGGLAAAIGADPRATEIAANALVALGLLEKGPAGYGNAEPARRFLVRTSPGYKGAILRHLHGTWGAWSALERTWRAGRRPPEDSGEGAEEDPERTRHFILGMENLTRELAPKLVPKLPLDGCRKVLDLGAGPGNYCLAFAQRLPEAEIVHFDLPEASAIAREFVAGKPGAERITFREGDFLRDPLGSGYDFVWASQIVHMLGEADAFRLIERVAEALAPGGRIAIHDHFLDESKTAPRWAALFGVHMLAVTESGRTYSFEEAEGWLRRAGVDPFRRVDYGGPSRILLGRKG
ncbi:MAG: class I SAM-dependent methyltransferase [Deferrisomatales bacterium]